MEKAKVAARARLRDIFDPNYEPLEEVHDDLDHSEAEDMETVNSSCGDASSVDINYHGSEVGESSKSNTAMEA